jgi:DNA-binding NarL/FixJ family response regulator
MATFAVPQTLPSAREVELVRLLGSLCAAIRIEQLERERDDALAALDRLTAVLEVQRARPEIAPAPLASLTQREAEVAVLIAEGLADREIAQRLYLSHHTVSQYVKRIYRKLDVDCRVGLTRLLLGAT